MLRSKSVAMIIAALYLSAATAGDQPRFLPPENPRDTKASEFRDQWYAKQFHALGQESLCCEHVTDHRVVRFTWLRTFHQPVVMRMEEMSPGQWTLLTRMTSGAGGYDPGQLIVDDRRSLTMVEVDPILTKVRDGSEFWFLPSNESLIRTESDGSATITVSADGAQWIVEVRDRNAYHYVDRNSPKSGLVREIGALLMQLSKRDFGNIY